MAHQVQASYMARLAQYSSSVESHGHQAAISHNRDGAQPPMQSFILPIDHPHARPGLQKQSGSGDGGPASSRKPIEIYDEEQKRRPGLHKKTKSSISLKSILIGDREKTKASRAKAPERDVEKKPKKPKSSTSLSAIFSRPKSSKGPKETYADYDKENQTPPRIAEPTSAPIWAQYATQLPDLVRDANKVPLNDSYEITQEISLYTPENYSPSKQRNFHDYSTPTLMQRGETNLRPKSDLLPSSPLANTFTGTLSRFRKRSAEIARDQESSSRPATRGSSRRSSLEIALSIVRRPSQDKKREKIAAPQAPTSKRSSRVMAAVAALQGKNQDTVQTPEIQPPPSPIMDARAVDDALEKLLVRLSPPLSIETGIS